MKKKKRSKRRTINDLRIHCIKRALERYDLDLSGPGFDNFLLKVKKGTVKNRLILKQSNTRQIRFIDDMYLVAWDVRMKCMITFLPPSALIGFLEQKENYELQEA